MKYASLAAHLRSLDANRWTASFDQLEGILGDKLPRSAHQHRAWWANTDSHVQATAWLEAGWQVESVHPSRQQVTFRRLRHSSGFARKREAMETRPTATNSSLPHSWDRSDVIECRVRLQWKPIGRVEMDVSGKLRFPVATSGPGLYRFTIDDSQVYVGESENVQRRFQHYRTPGPSQQTNIRMNRIFSEALRNGAEIGVAIATLADRADSSGQYVALDLSSKPVRLLLESAVLVMGIGATSRFLNRASMIADEAT